MRCMVRCCSVTQRSFNHGNVGGDVCTNSAFSKFLIYNALIDDD